MIDFKKFIPIRKNGDKLFKRTRSVRIIKWFLLSAVSFVILVILVGNILTYVAQKKAEEEFQKQNGSFASLRINLFSRSVTVTDLFWKSPSDSSQNKVSIHRVRLQGISLYHLVIQKQLHAKHLSIDSGAISFRPNQKKDSVKGSPGKSFPIEIENISLRNLLILFEPDSTSSIEAFVNLDYGTLKIDSLTTIQATSKMAFDHFAGEVTNLKIENKNGLYNSRVHKIVFNSERQSVRIDSLKLIPKYEKYKFAHVRNKQVSRLYLGIKQIEMNGLNFHKLFDSLVLVNTISIHAANLHSFRDKRMPFKNGLMAMPMKSLQKLPFALEIDSIRIDSTMIVIEEFAEQATQPGKIYFQNLNALMVGLSNRYYINKPKYSQLDASAKLMGSGLVTASFRFPLDGSALYSAEGKVSRMALKDINPILEHSAQIQIESGRLNELYFNFNYTDYKSTGSLEINYEDLKLISLNSDKDKTTNTFKTAVFNALIKDTKDESVSQSKRTGTIDTERDRKRFVFNLWWKSIQSGLKSSFIGDINLPASSGKKKK